MSEDKISVDISELLQLANDFEQVAEAIPTYLRKAVEVSARNVKDNAQDKVRRRKVLNVAAGSIDYELAGYTGPWSGVWAEIGYNKGIAGGSLGNLIEYGAPRAKAHMLVKRNGKTINVPVPGSPSRPLRPGRELQTALQETSDDFQRGIERAIDDAMRASGL